MKPVHLLVAALLSTSATANGLADPTRPSHAPRAANPAATQPVRVEGVFRSAERRLAIVNGKVVRAGDRVAGVQIDEILDDGVRYLRNGKIHTVRLSPASMPVRQATESGR
jgi:MSHA biogenesis protein MshK